MILVEVWSTQIIMQIRLLCYQQALALPEIAPVGYYCKSHLSPPLVIASHLAHHTASLRSEL